MWLLLKAWAKALKRDILALYLATRDKRVPWHAKILAGVVAGYALSPIDFIPDVIPILGYLDDVILLPLGILLVISLIPPVVMNDLRQEAVVRFEKHRPKSITAATIIIAIWSLLAGGATALLMTVRH